MSLRELLEPVSRAETVEPTRSYTLLGARWYGEGLFTKAVKPGSEIQAKALFRVESGDFVYNRLFAWKGSFALVAEEHHGSYVSNEFPSFRVKAALLDRRYLWWYFRQPEVWDQALGESTGGTPISRNRLKEERLLGFAIPLPPLDEQRRIVARIEAVHYGLGSVRRLQEEILKESKSVVSGFLQRQPGSTFREMRDLVRLRTPDVAVRADEAYEFAGVYCFGRGVFRGRRRMGSEFSYKEVTRLRRGNLVYPKLMAWEGAIGTVPPDYEGLVVSPEFPVFEVDESKVLPEVLDLYFRLPTTWPILAEASTGTNVRRRRLHPDDFLRLEMPVPARAVQELVRSLRRSLGPASELSAQVSEQVGILGLATLRRSFTSLA